MSQPDLVLASQSPRRRELLKLLGLPFEVTIAEVEEAPRAKETPVELVRRLSRAKADRARVDVRRRGDAWVIACDTIVALEEAPDQVRILGKPPGPPAAVAMLERLRGRSHIVYSAVTISDRASRAKTELATTRLTMRAYTQSEIAAYVASGDPLDKAGAYAIQNQTFNPVSKVEGCYASVMGLPLCHLARCLRRLGRSPAVDLPAACQTHTGHCCTVYQEILGS